jgi:ATP-dependent RNA circularization protein (DNA/RNA ligase family)
MAQKRSENTYQKINTIFKRDENNIIMPDAEFAIPELEWLRNCKFDATEKIDGTNIRIEVVPALNVSAHRQEPFMFVVRYKGKTDNAQVPPHLLKHLEETYPEEKVLEALGLPKYMTEEYCLEKGYNVFGGIPMCTIYGEGYGVKIQKGGNYIKNGVGFIVFDVKVGDMYLLRDSMEDIAGKLGAPVVPYMGQFTIDEAIEFVKKGFKSTIAENKDYDAEGLVLRAPNGLMTRRGERIIFKVKTCDFIKYKNKYGK